VKFDRLTLPVTDLRRSAIFYSRHFGFNVGEPEWQADVLLMRNPAGIDLALCRVPEVTQPELYRLGFRLVDGQHFSRVRAELTGDGIEVEDEVDRPPFHSLRFRDPDGHPLEIYVN
jgi:catechol 2,3-dioxygenase-like lactoylglutathione lyase family enzyme